MESSSTTTSRRDSTNRRALSRTISATWTWLRDSSSDDDATTSPSIERRMSVTSSGLSSTSSTMTWISGWLAEIDDASFWSSTVFPALGGATMRQRCPFPMGVTRSMTRVEISSGFASSRMRSWGSSAPRSLNGVLCAH